MKRIWFVFFLVVILAVCLILLPHNAFDLAATPLVCFLAPLLILIATFYPIVPILQKNLHFEHPDRAPPSNPLFQ